MPSGISKYYTNYAQNRPHQKCGRPCCQPVAEDREVEPGHLGHHWCEECIEDVHGDQPCEQIACMVNKENRQHVNVVANLEGIEIIKIMIDPGASSSVMPEGACTDVDMYETREARRKHVCVSGS